MEKSIEEAIGVLAEISVTELRDAIQLRPDLQRRLGVLFTTPTGPRTESNGTQEPRNGGGALLLSQEPMKETTT